VVGAAPQPIPAACSQIKNAVVIGVNRQALAHVATRHVSANLKRQVEALKSLTVVGRTQDRAILTGPFIGVSAHCEVNAPRINRICRYAFDAGQVPVIRPDPVQQRNPVVCARIPAVRTPNIRTRINQIWLAGTEDDPGHEASTAADHHVLEAVAIELAETVAG